MSGYVPSQLPSRVDKQVNSFPVRACERAVVGAAVFSI